MKNNNKAINILIIILAVIGMSMSKKVLPYHICNVEIGDDDWVWKNPLKLHCVYTPLDSETKCKKYGDFKGDLNGDISYLWAKDCECKFQISYPKQWGKEIFVRNGKWKDIRGKNDKSTGVWFECSKNENVITK